MPVDRSTQARQKGELPPAERSSRIRSFDPESETVFDRIYNLASASIQRREELLKDPGFGQFFTDHMALIDWDENSGWNHPRIVPYGPLALDPAAMVLHYGQEIFEGLKAYRRPDGSIILFRPEVNAARFANSARRMAMPILPEAIFLKSLTELVKADQVWVPPAGGEESLYLRPLMIATEIGLGVRAAARYQYLLIASPAGSYFPTGLRPVDVWLSTKYSRAAPGGTGGAKAGANYAASLLPQQQAAKNGCSQVVYLDAARQELIEEMGSNNIAFVYGRGERVELVTPQLTDSILPGVIRDSILTLAREIGITVTERPVRAVDVLNDITSGRITEVFGSGTAVVISPIGAIIHSGGTARVADGLPGPLTTRLRQALTDIQRGIVTDIHGWTHTILPRKS